MMDDKLTAFGRALRVRRRVFLWITAAGLLGLAVCLGLLPGSGIPPVSYTHLKKPLIGLPPRISARPLRGRAKCVPNYDNHTGYIIIESAPSVQTLPKKFIFSVSLRLCKQHTCHLCFPYLIIEPAALLYYLGGMSI